MAEGMTNRKKISCFGYRHKHLGTTIMRRTYSDLVRKGKAVKREKQAKEEDVLFTSREEEVLGLLAGLKTNDEMCQELSIKRGTLVNHFKNIRRKLRERTAKKEILTRYAVEHGYGRRKMAV